MSNSRIIKPSSEGTWTPGIAGATTAGSHTYSATTNRGNWKRDGRWITIRAAMVMATRDAAMAGQLKITGLPFPVLNDANTLQHTHILRPVSALNLSANYAFAIAYFVPNTTTATIWQMGGADSGAGSNMTGLDAATATGLLALNFDAIYLAEV